MVAVTYITLLLFAVFVINALPDVDLRPCNEYADDCLIKKPYVIRQFSDQSVMTWNEARQLCFNPNDDEVDGMATLDVSSQHLTSLDEQFDLLRSVCGVLQNADGRNVNCWVGGKLNENATGWIFDSVDTNRANYSPKLADSSRWGCVRNSDGSCKKDVEGTNLDNGEDYITLFQNRDYYFADWPENGGINEDFQTTAVVCNNAKFRHYDFCQCSCSSCDIYGDPYVSTFDGVAFHTKEYCAYYAVTPCTSNIQFDEDFPFQISTENIECFDGFSSCLQSVYLSLYDPISFDIENVIHFHHIFDGNLISTVVTFLDTQTFVPRDSLQTSWSNFTYLLLKNETTNSLNFKIWLNSKYESVFLQFYDLSGMDLSSLHLSSLRITLSSCFLKKSCGICGYFDNNQSTELMVRDPLNETNLINMALTQDYFLKNLSNPFNQQIAALISDYSQFWIDKNQSNEDCDEDDIDFNLCQLNYCNDECFCNDNDDDPTLYNGTKQIQCNYDLAACLGLTADSNDCKQLQLNNDPSVIEQYILDNAPNCARIVDLYCCFYPFCESKPSFCDFSASPTQNPSKAPFELPTRGPTREPTPEPTESPTTAPTNGPTKLPTAEPSENPSLKPTTFTPTAEPPTSDPTQNPTTKIQTSNPSENPTNEPTEGPTLSPTSSPTDSPLINTLSPTGSPTPQPTDLTLIPTDFPTINPTDSPTDSPTSNPTETPTLTPSEFPTSAPSAKPTLQPTPEPTSRPTAAPTNSPSPQPTNSPTDSPTLDPTNSPIFVLPSNDPTSTPSRSPNKSPTLQPSPVWPTVSPPPSKTFCKLTHDMDVIFVVHAQCVFNQQMCQNKRQFITDLIQSIKIGRDPRIGLMECTFSDAHIEYGIKLTDNSLNDINENSQLTQQNRNDLYLNKIETRLQCIDGGGTSPQKCLDMAMDILEDESDDDTIRKIVYIQTCQNEDVNVCDLKDKIEDDDVELITLNIGGNSHSVNDDCLYNFADFQDATNGMPELVRHICESAHSYSESSDDSSMSYSSDSQESGSQSESDDDSSEMKTTKKPTPIAHRHYGRRYRRYYVQQYSTDSDDDSE